MSETISLHVRCCSVLTPAIRGCYSLEPLAFDDNYFDMVRASYLGLGVPESEWQYMLEVSDYFLAPVILKLTRATSRKYTGC